MEAFSHLHPIVQCVIVLTLGFCIVSALYIANR